ncbi:MAG: hypothetical protein ACK4NW_10000, partial [Roseinatronobacter sp.]
MDATTTDNLPVVTIVNELLGNDAGGNTARIRIDRLVALVAALMGPTYAARAGLFGDLGWPSGSIGYVRNDANTAFNGVYKKSGSAGSGSWSRIGDLPTGAVEMDLILELRNRRIASTANANFATTTFPPGTLTVIYRQAGNAAIWMSLEGATPPPVTAIHQQDATGAWWQRVWQVSEFREALRDAGTLPLVNLGGTGDAITADLAPSVVALGITTIADGAEVSITPTATNTTTNPTLAAASASRGIRTADGGTWPVGGLVAGRTYVLRRVGTLYRVVRGDVTAAEVSAARDRGNHFGTQPISAVEGLEAALALKADRPLAPGPLPAMSGVIMGDLRASPRIFEDVEGLRPIAPGDFGRAVARWDLFYDGEWLPFIQAVVGNRPVYMSDAGRPYLDMGMTAFLAYTGPRCALFNGADGFTLSAAINARPRWLSPLSSPAVVIGVTRGDTTQSPPRIALCAEDGSFGYTQQRTDGVSRIDARYPLPLSGDQVLSITRDFAAGTGAALIDGVVVNTISVSSSSGLGMTTPLSLVIGGLRVAPATGSWEGRIYSVAFSPMQMAAPDLASLIAAQRSQMPSAPLSLSPVSEDFDGGFTGRGFTNGGGDLVGFRIRALSSHGDGRHVMARVEGGKGKRLTAAFRGVFGMERDGTYRGAWAYDPDGEWFDFDFTEDAVGLEYVSETLEAMRENVVYVANR